jgi:protein-tyrosine phosphatase
VDDGPRNWDEAVDLCRMAEDEGIETIVATPHVLRGRWRTTPIATLRSLAQELQSRLGTTPRILLGSECFFVHDIAEVLAAGETIIPLAGSRYVLIEFASNSVPPLIEQPFYRMQLEGWTPVIAHPERNVVFQHKPELLTSLVALGAKTQITAGSFTGHFGREAQAAAQRWLSSGLVHIIASDAHNTDRRPPRTRESLRVVTELAGSDVADALTRRNPAAVLAGRPLEFEPDPQPLRGRSGFFNGLRRFFRTS